MTIKKTSKKTSKKTLRTKNSAGKVAKKSVTKASKK